MGAVISVVFFVYLTYIGFKCVNNRISYIKYPYLKLNNCIATRRENFCIYILTTGLFACGSFLAVRLFVLEVLCIMIILKESNSLSNLSLPLYAYVVFLLWLVVGLGYSPSVTYGIRVILKYIYPLLIALAFSKCMINTDTLVISFKGARKIAFFSAVIVFIPFFELVIFPGVMWYGTARAINFISISMFSLALFYHKKNKKTINIICAFGFMVPCILWAFRTSVMGNVLALCVFYFIKNRLKALPVILGIAVLAVLAVFTIPQLSNKMFYKEGFTVHDLETGNISKDDIDSNGRFFMWEAMETRFYKGRELIGSGTGCVQEHMYTQSYLYGGIKIPHSDYVQMRCDNGDIGQFLYLLMIGMVIIHCFIVYHSNSNKGKIYTKICAISAASSLAGVTLTMVSDNTVNYSMCTLAYPFAFYGSMLGLMHTEKSTI